MQVQQADELRGLLQQGLVQGLEPLHFRLGLPGLLDVLLLLAGPTVDQIDISGQWPLAGNFYAVGRYNWSFLGKQTPSDPSPSGQLLEAIAGFEYNAGCWALRAVAQRLEAIAGTPNTTLFLQLELNDFGSVGSNPISLLRRSIPGYGKTNELSTSSSLLTTQ